MNMDRFYNARSYDRTLTAFDDVCDSGENVGAARSVADPAELELQQALPGGNYYTSATMNEV